MLDRGQHTYSEIVTQADAWAGSLAAVGEQAAAIGDWLNRPWGETVFTGCGSTYYLSLTAAVIWRRWTRLAARGVPGSEAWLFPDTALPATAAPLLVAVSRSGETTETLRAVDVYEARHGRDWLTIGCYEGRPLGERAPLAVIGRATEEESVAQTRSFTAMLVMAQAVASLMAGRDLAPLGALPDAARRLIGQYEPLAKMLGEDMTIQRFTFLGSGVYYGLACEAMLKMKEMSLSGSEAFHSLEFRHGPKSVVGPDMLVVGLVSDETRDQEAAVLAEMRDLGAKVLAIAEDAEGLAADYHISLASGLDDATRAPLALPVLQLLAYYRATAKGLDPDRPTNLTTVVTLP